MMGFLHSILTGDSHNSGDDTEERCSICGQPIHGKGHDAFPVENGRCCDECYETVVVPALMGDI